VPTAFKPGPTVTNRAQAGPARRMIPLLLASALAASAPGCGGKPGHVACYPAQGRVLVGEEPAAGVEILMLNAANPGNLDAPQPYATSGADGTFELSTFDPGDGAPAGDYVVTLRWPDGPPGPGLPPDRLGDAFTNPGKTPYKATVAAGAAKLDPFRIDPAAVKKAKAAK
jgi:hypothetical protein